MTWQVGKVSRVWEWGNPAVSEVLRREPIVGEYQMMLGMYPEDKREPTVFLIY